MAVIIPTDVDDTREVIHLESLARRRHGSGTRWGMLLVLLMRLMAVLWFLFGLSYWLRIISDSPAPLEAMPVEAGTIIVFFAVASLSASVGLWLAAPWGGVLWLITTLAEIAASWFMPAYIGGGRLLWLCYTALIVVYIIFTWMAAREREQF